MNVELKTASAQHASPKQQLLAALKPLSRYGKLVYLSMYVLKSPPSEELLSEMTGLDSVDIEMVLDDLRARALVDRTRDGQLVPLRFGHKKG